MRRVLPLCVTALALAVTQAAAGDANSNYYVLGAGSLSCGRLEAATPEQKTFFETWMAGYITATNALTPDTYNIAPGVAADQIVPGVLAICSQEGDPDLSLAVAAQIWLEGFYDRRQQRAP